MYMGKMSGVFVLFSCPSVAQQDVIRFISRRTRSLDLFFSPDLVVALDQSSAIDYLSIYILISPLPYPRWEVNLF